MTEIAFHLNVSEPQQYVQRLLAKVWKTQAKAVLIAPQDFLRSLSAALWSQTPTSFIAHSFASDSAQAQAAGCLVLGTREQLTAIQGNGSVLIQLEQSEQPVQGFERYGRCIEIVPAQEAAKAAARKRWKYYHDRGYPLAMHDMQARS